MRLHFIVGWVISSSGMTREEENIARGSWRRHERGWKRRRRPLAIKHGVSPALRIMPWNADNWLNRPDDPRRRAHRCSWRHGIARSLARDPSCLIDSKWFILCAVPLHLRHSPSTEAIIKILRRIVIRHWKILQDAKLNRLWPYNCNKLYFHKKSFV